MKTNRLSQKRFYFFCFCCSSGAAPSGISADEITIKAIDKEMLPTVLEGHKADQEELNAFGATPLGKSVDHGAKLANSGVQICKNCGK